MRQPLGLHPEGGLQRIFWLEVDTQEGRLNHKAALRLFSSRNLRAPACGPLFEALCCRSDARLLCRLLGLQRPHPNDFGFGLRHSKKTAGYLDAQALALTDAPCQRFVLPVLTAEVAWSHTHRALEHLGKTECIVIADLPCDLLQ